MSALDVLLRAREASARLRAIDEELTLLRERIGVQGHGYEACDKSGIRDPARHVIAFMDATADYDEERRACLQDLDEGARLCRGVAVLVSENLARALMLYYVKRLSIYQTADALRVSHRLIERCVCRATLEELDRYGVPRLLAAGANSGTVPKARNTEGVTPKEAMAASRMQP